MKGLHLTADLYRCRCDAAWLMDAQRLGQWCLATIESLGLQPAQHLFHAAAAGAQGPAHATATVLLAGSHVCVHTWPEERAVNCDVYFSHLDGDRSAQARGLMAALVQRFQPEWTEQRSLDRGEED